MQLLAGCLKPGIKDIRTKGLLLGMQAAIIDIGWACHIVMARQQPNSIIGKYAKTSPLPLVAKMSFYLSFPDSKVIGRKY